jgi:hypothetical protein
MKSHILSIQVDTFISTLGNGLLFCCSKLLRLLVRQSKQVIRVFVGCLLVAWAGAFGFSSALAQTDEPVLGRVVAWGSNSLGLTNVPADLTNVIAIAAGSVHSIALKSDGTVRAWGSGNKGETNMPLD